MPDDRDAKEPWLSFLKELDEQMLEEVHFIVWADSLSVSSMDFPGQQRTSMPWKSRPGQNY